MRLPHDYLIINMYINTYMNNSVAQYCIAFGYIIAHKIWFITVLLSNKELAAYTRITDFSLVNLRHDMAYSDSGIGSSIESLNTVIG